MAAPLSQMELERAARIAQNKRRMAEIGVVEARQAMDARQRAEAADRAATRAAKHQRVTVERVQVPVEALRRTSRCEAGAGRGWGPRGRRRVCRRTCQAGRLGRCAPRPPCPPAWLPTPPRRHRKDVDYNEGSLWREVDAAAPERPARITVLRRSGGGGGGRRAVGVRARGWAPCMGTAGEVCWSVGKGNGGAPLAALHGAATAGVLPALGLPCACPNPTACCSPNVPTLLAAQAGTPASGAWRPARSWRRRCPTRRSPRHEACGGLWLRPGRVGAGLQAAGRCSGAASLAAHAGDTPAPSCAPVMPPQVLTASMVSTGFWCSAPRGLLG